MAIFADGCFHLCWRLPYVTRHYCAFVLAGDISARQHCAPTTMLAGDSYMCHQSIFHVSAQIVFGLVLCVVFSFWVWQLLSHTMNQIHNPQPIRWGGSRVLSFPFPLDSASFSSRRAAAGGEEEIPAGMRTTDGSAGGFYDVSVTHHAHDDDPLDRREGRCVQTRVITIALFAWLISHQPAVLFLRTNQHQSSTTSQTNRLHVDQQKQISHLLDFSS
jgi:hypothetical protein